MTVFGSLALRGSGLLVVKGATRPIGSVQRSRGRTRLAHGRGDRDGGLARTNGELVDAVVAAEAELISELGSETEATVIAN
jgi:hypothetical protein